MASIPAQKLLTSLSLKVLLPLGIGQAARACRPVRGWAGRHHRLLSHASEALLLLTVYATFVSTFAKVGTHSSPENDAAPSLRRSSPPPNSLPCHMRLHLPKGGERALMFARTLALNLPSDAAMLTGYSTLVS
jgi:hypothetical protein